MYPEELVLANLEQVAQWKVTKAMTDAHTNSVCTCRVHMTGNPSMIADDDDDQSSDDPSDSDDDSSDSDDGSEDSNNGPDDVDSRDDSDDGSDDGDDSCVVGEIVGIMEDGNMKVWFPGSLGSSSAESSDDDKEPSTGGSSFIGAFPQTMFCTGKPRASRVLGSHRGQLMATQWIWLRRQTEHRSVM